MSQKEKDSTKAEIKKLKIFKVSGTKETSKKVILKSAGKSNQKRLIRIKEEK